MSYSISLLTTVEECDNMLEIANTEKADLEYQKTSRERRRDSYSDRSVQVTADLQAVTTEIASLDTVIAGLPDGEVKDDMVSRKTRLEYRQFLLQERSENFGTLALLEQELAVALSDQQIAEVDAFITAVDAHKATL